MSSPSAETALEQWAAGLRRLADVPDDAVPVHERVVRAIEAGLRRRLGGRFTLAELVALYDEGTGWCSDLAVATAPESPDAWDARVTTDAAFGRYVRAATDYAGGRLRTL